MNSTPEIPNPQSGQEKAQQPVQQLTIVIKETDHYEHRPLFLKILELVKASDGTGATVLKGMAGYSSASRSIQTAGFADIEEKLPLVILIFDAADKISAMLPQLETMVQVNGGLIAVQSIEAFRSYG